MVELIWIDPQLAAYQPVLRLQQQLLDRVSTTEPDKAYLLTVEHDPPVITLGRRAREENILASREQLAAYGIELHHTRRGGDVTYHGPGQLVGYLVSRLGPGGGSVRQHVRNLEETVIRLLARFGIQAGRNGSAIGVWVGPEKIAAVGVGVRRWISYHGIAMNVSNDLAAFRNIVPCGIHGCRVTSLERLLGREVSMNELKALFVKEMSDVFGFHYARQASIEEITAEQSIAAEACESVQ